MSADAVRARIAALMGPAVAAQRTRVGGFTLRPDQERAHAMIVTAVREFGGALVADPPGTGKTVLALAAARTLLAGVDGELLVIAPAALRAQWAEASARAECAVRFVSIESLGRGAAAARSARVVIVDEAHHARTPTTARYRRLAECCAGATVLLLTATPVVNRVADRDALLALFLGARAASLTPGQRARCVVRLSSESGAHGRPVVRALGTIGRAVDVPGLARAIAELPPPLAVSEGTPAAALVGMTLAMAWRSSLAALDAALRRRIQRGEAMRDLLRSGHAPSRAMLRHWVLHDRATQLAMEALLAPAPAAGRTAVAGSLEALDRHLGAVAAIRATIAPHLGADATARAESLRRLACAHADRRMVVFARHAETIRALHGALRRWPGVVAIVGSRVHAAAGRWTRDEVLRAIGPRARPLRDDDPRAIRMILATDVVAEGVEMQGVGIVVHADLPWTPARIEQRTGRITRAGSAHDAVITARLAAPRGARTLIRLGARLRRKADARRTALRDARAQRSIATTLERWAAAGRADGCTGVTAAVVSTPGHRAFVAVVGAPPRWLTGERRDGRWRISSAPHRVARLLRTADAASDRTGAEPIAEHRALVERALARRAAVALTDPAGRDEPTPIAPPRAHQRVARTRAVLGRLLAHAPALARGEIAARQTALLERLARPMALGLERRLDAVLASGDDDASVARRLGALLAGETGTTNEKSRPGDPDRLRCLLVLSPASAPPTSAPRGASPGTAAPR